MQFPPFVFSAIPCPDMWANEACRGCEVRVFRHCVRTLFFGAYWARNKRIEGAGMSSGANRWAVVLAARDRTPTSKPDYRRPRRAGVTSPAQAVSRSW